MFVSKRLLILPLGLLITLPGCSGSRLRQILTPDRDFMTLSELDDDDSARGSKRSAESVAALSKDADDESDGDGLFRISHWLKPKKHDSLPPDPFVDDDFNNTKAVNPITTVGLSKEQTDERAEKLVKGENRKTSPPGIQNVTATAIEASSSTGKSKTFADIMAEFKDEPDEGTTEPDEVDVMEQAWIANQENRPGMSNFDNLLADEQEAKVDEGGVFLNFDMLNEDVPVADDLVPELNFANADHASEKIEDLIPDLDVTETSDPFSDSWMEFPVPADVVENKSAGDDSLWQSSDSEIGWETAGSNSAANHDEAIMGPNMSTMGTWNFGPNTGGSDSALQLPSIVQSAEPVDRQVPFSTVVPFFTGETSIAPKIVQTNPATLSNDPFLNDFTTQAATPASTSDSGATESRVSSAGMIRNVSPRTWLILLGAVVIAYLLFAPEPKNLQHENNR